jgi:hypothetical protein
VNGSGWDMAGTNSNAAFTIYAPTTAGTSGYILNSTGATPGWVSPGSIYSGYLEVKDVRDASRLPNYFTDKRVTAWFNNVGMPEASTWYSGLHVKGWTSSYSSW